MSYFHLLRSVCHVAGCHFCSKIILMVLHTVLLIRQPDWPQGIRLDEDSRRPRLHERKPDPRVVRQDD